MRQKMRVTRTISTSVEEKDWKSHRSGGLGCSRDACSATPIAACSGESGLTVHLAWKLLPDSHAGYE